MTGFPHVEITDAVQELMESISICRDEDCAVPKKHPFYPVPQEPPFYYGKRPCLPVVPTNLATQKVMIIGEYPNCRFASIKRKVGNRIENFVPVDNITEPFEGGRYYDGEGIRDYPTEDSLIANYLDPLGIDLRQQVWMTNINKCFLIKPSHIRAYNDIGWTEPPTEASYTSENDYLKIASVCVTRHLLKELELCKPQLIIALGEKAYRIIHSSNDFKTPAPDITFSEITGKVLKANETIEPLDNRATQFTPYNIVHLFHPSSFVRNLAPEWVDMHWNQHIPVVKAFLQTINLN